MNTPPITPEGAAAAAAADTAAIRAALTATGGNIEEAAVTLGVPLRTLHRRIVDLDLRDYAAQLRKRPREVSP